MIERLLEALQPCARSLVLTLASCLVVWPVLAQTTADANSKTDTSCLFPADLAPRVLAGDVDVGDLPVTAAFVVDEQLLLDEGRVQATVEASLDAGPLELLEHATLCLFLLLDVDGESILGHQKRLDLDDFRTVQSLRYVLRADLPEGTRRMIWVAREATTGIWGAVPLETPGGEIAGPSFTAKRVPEYEGTYYELTHRTAGGLAQIQDSGATKNPTQPQVDDTEANDALNPFPKVQIPRMGRRPGQGRAPVEKLAGQQIVRLVPPRGQPVSGGTIFHVLSSTVAVERVVIEVDGKPVAEDKRAPFRLRVPLADPAVEQTVRAVAFDGLGVEMADDTLRINQLDAPFRVSITGFEGDPGSGSVTLEGRASIPVDARLDRLELWYNDTLLETFKELRIAARVETPSPQPTDYIRLAAFLADGDSIDTVVLVTAPDVEEVDVNLVEVQAVVTNAQDQVVEDLSADDFTIMVDGKAQPTASFAHADDVPLVLGLLVDSSGSMELLMHDTRRAAIKFLGQTVLSRDQAFLVDFDQQPRLLHGQSGDLPSLMRSMGQIQASGRTALYDAVVFSLLQFDAQPGGESGRRALVVLSDGDDIDSRFGPKNCVEMAQAAGVPIYVIGLGALDSYERPLSKRDLKRLTEGTGGRLYFVDTFAQLADAYDEINAELRSQYSLGFYTDSDLTAAERRKVKVKVGKGLKARTVVGGGTP